MNIDSSILANQIVLAVVNISVWTGAKRDKGVAQEIARRKGASSDAGSYTKYLVDKTMIDFVMNKAQAIRIYHYRNTVAWDDNGARALPVGRWFEYREQIEELINEFNIAVADFCTWYGENWNDQQHRLGDMFNPQEYPYPDEIRDKFRFKMSFRQVEHGDFRTQLPGEIAQAVQDSMQNGLREGLKMATAECWGRVAECMQKVYEKLFDPDGIFRDSLIENVKVLVDTVRPLNIGGDTLLSTSLDQIENEIASCWPDLLRVDKAKRQQVADASRKFYDLAVLHSSK